MILGTVQLGMNYGINNAIGKPPFRQAIEILDIAYKNGIRRLDTAPAYEESEELIGYYHQRSGNSFDICTKLSIDFLEKNKSDIYSIKKVIARSCEKLKVPRLYCYYLHRFEQCKNAELIATLEQIKHEGLIDNVGISIYFPKELEYICSFLAQKVDIVQIPYNIFSLDLWNDVIKEAHDKGIRIFARSIFLQGLVFKRTDDEFVKKIGAVTYLEFIHKLAEKLNVSISQLCFDVVKSNGYIDDILMGCETIEQLSDNIGLKSGFTSFDNGLMHDIEKVMDGVPDDMINPSEWGKYN
ncbi:aldo/keto reductase [Butyrivibrio sp. YAB3001]|uniref:aldo/keto reductase n=1 Tax=Butyrivibrio sp. YAB3001 TaxID=1520812 RepID=UPI0008F69035|nr:aldo/keto reductase [Butyrivibrio sp. YAB3001]SFB93957.1 Predicted oxidoreductase [Butyrivibrio sp. YAB3001]